MLNLIILNVHKLRNLRFDADKAADLLKVGDRGAYGTVDWIFLASRYGNQHLFRFEQPENNVKVNVFRCKNHELLEQIERFMLEHYTFPDQPVDPLAWTFAG